MAVGLPDQQPDPRVERPGLSRPVAGSPRAAAQDQQLPRVHRPRLPRPVRGVVRAGHQRAAGHDQEHRVRHHRPGLRGRLGRSRSRPRCGPARRSPSSAPARRGWPAPPSSTRPGTSHRLRARRPHRRAADVRHPEHEARQERRPAPRRPDGGGGRRVRHRAARSARTCPAQKLREDFDAVVLCGGATKPNDFFAKTEGRNLKGIHFAMEFLHANTKSLLDSQPPGRQVHLGEGQGRDRHRRRRHRHRLRRHVAAARLPEPPAIRDPAAAAAGRVPRTTPGRSGRRSTSSTTARRRRRRSSATTRAQYSIQTTKFVGDERGHLKEIHTVRVEWVKDNGRAMPRNVPGTEKVFPAQLVLLAMGFSGPENQLLDQLGVEKDARTNAKAEHGQVQHERARACSRPATCGAGRAWSSGRSTRAAGPPASATAI